MQPATAYTLTTLGLTALTMSAVAIFNVFIDPFDIYQSPKIPHINEAKPALATHGRLTKAIAICKRKPKVLIFGSSRAALGLNPNHITGVNPKEAYNAALDSANIYEIRSYLEHSLFCQPLVRTVIVGLDYQMFDETATMPTSFSSSRLCRNDMTNKDVIETALSTDASADSASTLISNLLHFQEHPNYYFDTGQRDERLILDRPAIERWSTSLCGDRISLPHYRFSNHAIGALSDIVHQCAKHHVNLHLFVSPAHALEWENLHSLGCWDDFKNWKREMVKISPFWDFSGYNSFTTEPLSAKEILPEVVF